MSENIEENVNIAKGESGKETKTENNQNEKVGITDISRENIENVSPNLQTGENIPEDVLMGTSKMPEETIMGATSVEREPETTPKSLKNPRFQVSETSPIKETEKNKREEEDKNKGISYASPKNEETTFEKPSEQILPQVEEKIEKQPEEEKMEVEPKEEQEEHEENKGAKIAKRGRGKPPKEKTSTTSVPKSKGSTKKQTVNKEEEELPKHKERSRSRSPPKGKRERKKVSQEEVNKYSDLIHTRGGRKKAKK